MFQALRADFSGAPGDLKGVSRGFHWPSKESDEASGAFQGSIWVSEGVPGDLIGNSGGPSVFQRGSWRSQGLFQGVVRRPLKGSDRGSGPFQEVPGGSIWSQGYFKGPQGVPREFQRVLETFQQVPWRVRGAT